MTEHDPSLDFTPDSHQNPGNVPDNNARAAVFQRIVHQALSGLEWRDMYGDSMKAYGISPDEIEEEITRQVAAKAKSGKTVKDELEKTDIDLDSSAIAKEFKRIIERSGAEKTPPVGKQAKLSWWQRIISFLRKDSDGN